MIMVLAVVVFGRQWIHFHTVDVMILQCTKSRKLLVRDWFHRKCLMTVEIRSSCYWLFKREQPIGLLVIKHISYTLRKRQGISTSTQCSVRNFSLPWRKHRERKRTTNRQVTWLQGRHIAPRHSIATGRDGTGSGFLTRDPTRPGGFWPGDPTRPVIECCETNLRQRLDSTLH